MQRTNDIKQIKTIGKITYIVKTVFNEDNNPLSKTQSRNNLTGINNYVINS